MLNKLRDLHQIVHKYSVLDIDELIRLWRSWGKRSRSQGTDVECMRPSVTKFVQAVSPEPLEGFLTVFEIVGSKVKVTWDQL